MGDDFNDDYSNRPDWSLGDNSQRTSGEPYARCYRDDIFLKAKHFTISGREWIIKDLLATGVITVIVGSPGMGKSTVALTIAALVSNDSLASPFGNKGTISADRHGNVLWIGDEDSVETDTLPRAKAAGADFDKLAFWRPGFDRYPTISKRKRDEPNIIAKIKTYPNVKLVVFDSVDSMYSGYPKTRTGRRQALIDHTNAARAQNYAVIVNGHFSRSPTKTGDPLDRISGGSVLGNTVRKVIYVEELAPDDSNNAARKFGLFDVKTSITGFRSGLAYTIEGVTITGDHDEEIETSRIKWLGRIEADQQVELVSRSRKPLKGNVSQLAVAIEFLRDFLSGGERLVDDLEKAAEAAGISLSTLRKARSAIGVESRKLTGEGQSSSWVCWLPQTESPASVAEQPAQVDQLTPNISSENNPDGGCQIDKTTLAIW